MAKHFILSVLLAFMLLSGYGQTATNDLSWPAITKEAKPWTRWWWLGSAVDQEGITYRLD